MNILRRCVQSVPMDSEWMIGNLTHILEDVFNDSRNDSHLEMHHLEQMLEHEQQRKRQAMEAFFDKRISSADFQFMNQQCDSCIADISDRIASVQNRQESQLPCTDDWGVIRNIMTGETATDDFYGNLLQDMTIYHDGRVEVILNGLSARWIFLLPSASRRTQLEERNCACGGDI